MHRRTVKMEFDNVKLMECIDWEQITKDTVTIKVDGEKLRETLYDELHVVMRKHHENSYGLYSNGILFCNITPGGIFSENDCKQLAIEIKNTMNNRIRSTLNLK